MQLTLTGSKVFINSKISTAHCFMKVPLRYRDRRGPGDISKWVGTSTYAQVRTSKEYFVPASLAAVVWRSSWRGIWIQGFLSIISAISLVSALSLQRLPVSLPSTAMDVVIAHSATVQIPAILYWMCPSGAMTIILAIVLSMVRLYQIIETVLVSSCLLNRPIHLHVTDPYNLDVGLYKSSNQAQSYDKQRNPRGFGQRTSRWRRWRRRGTELVRPSSTVHRRRDIGWPFRRHLGDFWRPTGPCPDALLHQANLGVAGTRRLRWCGSDGRAAGALRHAAARVRGARPVGRGVAGGSAPGALGTRVGMGWRAGRAVG